MVLLRVIFVLGVLHTVHSQVELDSPYRIQNAFVGDTVEIACSVRNAEEDLTFPMLWIESSWDGIINNLSLLSKNEKLISINKRVYHPNNRFDVKFRKNASTLSYTFKISDFQESDAGFYVCRVQNSNTTGIPVTSVELRVQRPLEIIFTSQESVKDFGDKATFACEARCDENVSTRWYKVDRNNKDLQIPVSQSVDKNRFLETKWDRCSPIVQILHLKRSDAGIYRCEVIAAGGKQRVFNDTELIIRSPPIVSHLNSTKSLTLKEGQSGRLECNAEGYPLPEISWFRENHEILPNEKLIHLGNILTIPSARKRHSGIYLCGAKNNLGEDSHRVLLKVEEP